MSLGERSPKHQSSAMAFSVAARYTAFLMLCVCVLSTESVDAKPPFSFSFEQFEKDRSFDAQIAVYGDAEIRNSTVRMFGKGRIICKKPISFFGTNPGFSTNFSFSISVGYGEGLAFLLFPNNMSLISTNADNSGSSPRFLAVKFGSYIAIDVGGTISVKSSNLSDVDLASNSVQRLQSWIDYDGTSKIIEVRISKFPNPRPVKSLASCPVDLSNALWREAMYVGISSSNGNNTQASNVYSWSFEVKHGAPYLMHSDPLDPKSISVRSHEEPLIHARISSPWRTIVALLIGAGCGAFVASAVFIMRLRAINRHPIAPIECPVLCVESGHEKILLDGSKVVVNNAK